MAECGADYSYNDDDVVIVLDSEEENEYIQASSQDVIFSKYVSRRVPAPPAHWDRRVIQTNHIKFRTCKAFVPN